MVEARQCIDSGGSKAEFESAEIADPHPDQGNDAVAGVADLIHMPATVRIINLIDSRAPISSMMKLR
ncbi:hypothetical protein IP85_10555 [Rhizobium sp. AAP116]|nr:hypothetical protein IP85_10555 [Rhizobium sp. AAP116]